MAKFIITGDWHWRGTNPKSRLDNYQEALTSKIREVFTLAKEHNAIAILQPGDLTHSPNINLNTVGDFTDLLTEAPVPIISIPGNHDTGCGNLDVVPRTPFGLLSRLGLIKNAHGGLVMMDCEEEVLVSGHGFNYMTDTDKSQYAMSKGISDTATIIHLTHGMLLEKEPGFDIRHTLISELELLPDLPDVLVVGHEHIGFGIKEITGKLTGKRCLVINPGALGRLTAHIEEMERQVQVCLLTIEDGNISADLISLQTANPGYEVLSREHIEAEQEREERMQKFLGLLSEEGQGRFLEVLDIIEDIAAREMLPEAVRNEALSRFSAAKEQLLAR